MSQSALLKAVRDHLQAVLELDGNSCELGFDGQPTATAGEQYVSIWPGDWQGASEDADLTEVYGCMVTVTRRLGYCPEDSWGPEVWAKANEGLEAVCRRIITAIHGEANNASILQKANDYLAEPADGGNYWGFSEKLVFRGGGRPEKKQPGWFSARDASRGKGRSMNVGVAQTLSFFGAKRTQAEEEMT